MSGLVDIETARSAKWLRQEAVETYKADMLQDMGAMVSGYSTTPEFRRKCEQLAVFLDIDIKDAARELHPFAMELLDAIGAKIKEMSHE